MTLATQWTTLVTMFAAGSCLGILLDSYRLISRRFSLRGWPVSLFDLLFWVLAAWLVFAVLLWSNWGEMRFYLLLVLLAGLFVYFRLLTKPISTVLTKVFHFIEKLIRLLVRGSIVLLYRPIAVLILFMWRIIQWVALFIWQIVTKVLSWMTSPVWKMCRPYIVKCQRWWAMRKKGNDDEPTE